MTEPRVPADTTPPPPPRVLMMKTMERVVAVERRARTVDRPDPGVVRGLYRLRAWVQETLDALLAFEMATWRQSYEEERRVLRDTLDDFDFTVPGGALVHLARTYDEETGLPDPQGRTLCGTAVADRFEQPPPGPLCPSCGEVFVRHLFAPVDRPR